MIDLRAKVSPHFRWGEMLRTDHRQFLAQQENPPPQVRENLRHFCSFVLEPAREAVGSLLVNSGYRCPALNTLIGGSPTSAHMHGCAADVHPLDVGLVEAFERIASANLADLDQLIFEFGRWVHVGGAVPGRRPRHQLLMIFDTGRYLLWNPLDPRIAALREINR